VQVVNLGVTGPTVIDAEAFTGDPWDAVETLMDAAGCGLWRIVRPTPCPVCQVTSWPTS